MLICDTHADTLYRRAMAPGSENDVTLEKLKKGKVALQTLAFFIGASPKIESIRRVFEKMAEEKEKMDREGFAQLDDPRDAREGRCAYMLSVEGCDLMENDLALLPIWRKAGVRMAALTWNYQNCVGTPASINDTEGLTPFGREAVREMGRLGIAPDTSHLNIRGFYDLLEMGAVPLASHSCCRALCGHKRNLTDAQLKALFSAGGYVGVNFYPAFLREDGKAGLSDVCDHILHMLEMGGESKIGFGSDFDGIEKKPEGLSGPQDLGALMDALKKRGLDEKTIRGIAGENLLAYYERFDPRI